MYIDPHVHCRDFEQTQKETIAHALKVAESVGIGAIFDMPNTQPAITTRELIEKRLKLAEEANSNVFYGLYAGITADPKQIKEVVDCYNEFFPRVIGLKLFAGHSVGNLGVIEEEKQNLVYKTLAELNYKGVLAVHCEKESFIKNNLFNPKKPITHCLARPPVAEFESVKDQIKFAIKNNFKGNLHICHVSVPESVDLIKKAKDKLRISCAATPHHCLLNNEIMNSENGIMFKVNPPIRDFTLQRKILEMLKKGDIDFLETDHAPHTMKEKTEQFMSGIPQLPFYPKIIELLKKKGFSDKRIKEITLSRIQDIFRIDLEEKELTIGNDYSEDYCFNPYEKL